MRILLAITILVLASCSVADKKQYSDSKTTAILTEKLDSITSTGNYEQAIAFGRKAYALAGRTGNTRLAVSTGARLGRLFYKTFEPDSMYFYFDVVMQDAETLKMYPELIMIHNTTGVFNLINALEFENAIHHFHTGMEYARESGDNDWYYRLLVNVSIIQYIRKDSAGLATAGEIDNYGQQTGNTFFNSVGAQMYAYMYHALGNDRMALSYLQKAMQWPEYSTGSNSCEPLYASVLAALGRDREAEDVFRHCIDSHTDADSTLRVETYAGYGQFLKDRGRYAEAVRYLLKGLDITETHHLYFYGYNIYRNLSDIYQETGDYSLSVKYLNKYYSIKDNVFNVERERSFNNLIQKYEHQKTAIELQEKDLLLLRQRQIMELVGAAFVVALILVLAVVMRNRAQNKMYQQLIIKYNAYKEREERLLQRLSEEGEKRTDTENTKIRQLFDRMCVKMLDERLYTQKSLTVEDMAAMLGTNRSYLSKAVNTYAGVSFNAYLNSLRIKESIKILSDPENDMPIKQVADEVGYSNMTSFYNNFVKETGIPPSKFRSESQNIHI